MIKFPLRIKVILFIIYSWILIMLASVIDSITFGFVDDFVKHFTNWAWTLEMIFFFLLVTGWIGSDLLFEIMCKYFLLPLWGLSWIVFVLVLALVLRDGNFVLRYLVKHKSGWVFFGNAFYHYIPPILFSIIFVGMSVEIHAVFNKWTKDFVWTKIEYVLMFIYLTYLAPLFVMCLYAIIFDYKKIYDTTMPLYLGLIICLIVLTIFNGLGFILLTQHNIIDNEQTQYIVFYPIDEAEIRDYIIEYKKSKIN